MRLSVWGAAAGLLLAGLVPVAPASSALAAGSRAAAPKPAAKTATEAPDAVSALALARLSKKRIEVLSERTEMSSTFANPSGTFTTEARVVPFRYKDGQGAWRDLDLTMAQAADGSVKPRQREREMRLSGASAAAESDAVTMDEGSGRSMVLGWSGKLPKPTTSGEETRYAEVEPGVDLRFQARRNGFEQLLTVKTRPSKPVSWDLPLKLAGLTAREDTDGGVSLLDDKGKVVSRFLPASAWDAKVDPKSGDPVSVSPVKLSVKAAGKDRAVLTVTPDAAWMADPARQYPVTVDPAYAQQYISPTYDAFVQTGYTSDQSGSTELKAGTYDGGTNVARSYLTFPLPSLAGKQIISGYLGLYETWSYSCQAREVEAWDTTIASTATRWTNQPGWGSKQGSVSVAQGFSSACGSGWIGIPLTGMLQTWQAAGWTQGSVVVKAASETDSYGWKKFASSETTHVPQIVFEYNRAPETPSGVGFASPSPVGSYVSSETPAVEAAVSDADGNLVRGVFEVWDGAARVLGPVDGTLVNSGEVSTYTIPAANALTEGHTYTVRAYAKDEVGTQSGGYGSSGSVTVDVTPTGAPIVTSTVYPSDNSWHGGAGVSGVFTLSAPAGTSDLTGYYWGLDAAPISTQVVNPAAGATQADLTLTPTTDGRHTLQVQAVDRAGNLSSITSYTFEVGRAGLSRPLDGGRFARRVPLALQVNDQGLTHAVFQFRRGASAAWRDIPVGHLTTAPGGAVTRPVQLSGIGGYLNWDALATLGPAGGVVDLRALTYTSTDTTTVAFTTDDIQIVVDPTADGAASTKVGPGSVNLLTGDYSVSTTDASAFGMSVTRVMSSQDPGAGWVPQGELLSEAGRTVADLSLFPTGYSDYTRSTTIGHDNSDSLEITPFSWVGTDTDSFVSLGGGSGAMRLGMRAGHRYRASGWVYVPAATGVSGVDPTFGLRIIGLYKDAAGSYMSVTSAAASAEDQDGWRQVRVDLAIPAGATEAFFRVYNGHPAGGGPVYWDDFSVREVVAPFGPGWSGGAGSDVASYYQSLRFPTANSAELTLTGDSTVMFTRAADNTSFTPEPGAETLALATDTVAGRFKLTEADGTITYFTQQTGSDLYLVDQVTPPDAAGSARYVYDVDAANKTARISRVVNPAEPGVTGCVVAAPAAPGRGCEVLEYVYAPTTTATPTAWGDIAGQVQAIKVWSTDPATGAVSAIEVAHYAYDISTSLQEVWDPRLETVGKPVLKTTYWYDDAGRLSSVVSPGETPWTFTYDGGQLAASNTGRPNPARISKVARGTVDTTITYQVPLTRATGGPYDLDGPTVATWGQGDVATDATAVFPPQAPAPTAVATAASPGPDGYATAAVHYLDASGREVNTATPGGYIGTTEYDRFGNTIRTLDATNRMTALGQGPDAGRWLAELGLTGESTVARARALDTVTTYTPDGTDPLSTTGPARLAALDKPVPDPDGAGPLPGIEAGTKVVARLHTTTVYDEGKPDAATYHLATTQQTAATLFGYDPAYPDLDPRVVKNEYDPVLGGTSGWTLRKTTRVRVDAVTGGANLTSSVKYDAAGRAVESRKVDSAGGDARTTETVFWTAGANPDAADGSRCGNRPEWAGQPCVTRPGGTVAGTAPSQLPTEHVSAYTRAGEVEVTSETANGQTRTTTTTHDAADRIVSVTTTGTSSAGTAVDKVYSVYADTTGRLVETYSTDAAGNETGRIRRDYDAEGRLQAYTDADSGTTSTTFDAYGRPATVTMSANIGGTTVALGSKTFTYDLTKDPRGLVTSVTDSVAGTISATYGPDGRITSQIYPGGIVQNTTFDASGSPVARTYTRDTTLVYSEQVVVSTHGKWASHAYNGASRTYTYDRIGRLTRTASTAPAGGTCTIRSYIYDNRANRTSRTISTGGTPAAGGDCTASVDPAQTVTDTHSYDAADRLTDPGYTYDAFGRTTALPAKLADGTTGTLTNGYYVNDLVASQTLDTTRQTWTLDPAQRSRTYTVESLTNGAWGNAATKLNHYDGDNDNPAWIVEKTSDGASAPVTRMLDGIDGSLAATTTATGDTKLQLANLHGDIAVEYAADGSGLTSRFYDEFGNPEQITPAKPGKDRYGWVGGAQRSGDTLGDTLLMGVRLYSPGLGRFLQVDPVPGGNENSYGYPADPVNSFDLSGMYRSSGLCNPLGWCGRNANASERRLCSKNAYRCLQYKLISSLAYSVSEQYFPKTSPREGAKLNAFRHMIWIATMSLEMGDEWAGKWANAHEGADTSSDHWVDLGNNALGRGIANAIRRWPYSRDIRGDIVRKALWYINHDMFYWTPSGINGPIYYGFSGLPSRGGR
ncbi:MAG TPA: DNRLRE domain-containing protein [Kineosporiaceae bacterium]|nr:DNRLRE domain-containing protein [Kineosporiaceae bacterium]